MKFLVDARLPPGLCAGLAKRGHDAVHVADVLSGQTPDSEINAFAVSQGRILITKDDDFFSSRCYDDGLCVVWLRIGNATNAALKAWLEARWDAIELALADGDLLIEVQ